MVPYAPLQNLTILLRDLDPKNSGAENQMFYHTGNRLALLRIAEESDQRHRYPSQKPLPWPAGKAPVKGDLCQKERRAQAWEMLSFQRGKHRDQDYK